MNVFKSRFLEKVEEININLSEFKETDINLSEFIKNNPLSQITNELDENNKFSKMFNDFINIMQWTNLMNVNYDDCKSLKKIDIFLINNILRYMGDADKGLFVLYFNGNILKLLDIDYDNLNDFIDNHKVFNKDQNVFNKIKTKYNDYYQSEFLKQSSENKTDNNDQSDEKNNNDQLDEKNNNDQSDEKNNNDQSDEKNNNDQSDEK